jgi:hypothetical protein
LRTVPRRAVQFRVNQFFSGRVQPLRVHVRRCDRGNADRCILRGQDRLAPVRLESDPGCRQDRRAPVLGQADLHAGLVSAMSRAE